MLQEGEKQRSSRAAARAAADPQLFRSAEARRGHVHDIEAMRVSLCRRYFGGDLGVRVTWGRARRGRWSLTFGTYDFTSRSVRLHPRLDRVDVPAFFVEAVLFHELLHHVVGAVKSGRRRLMHTARFRELEAGYEHARLASRWQEENLERLLGRGPSARRGLRGRPHPRRQPSLF